MKTLLLRPLTLPDKQAIEQWPAYPDELSEMNYALRKNGWLDEFHDHPGNSVYAVMLDETLVAFTLLAGTGMQEAEFRIAVYPHYLGKGLGKQATLSTLHKGFQEHGLRRIHLIVRKTKPKAMSLYEKTGFRQYGECTRMVNGQSVAFYEMECLRNTLEQHYG